MPISMLKPMMFDNFREAYATIGQYILANGEDAAPRGLATKEVLGASFVIDDPYDMLATGTGRKLNTRFAAADAIQVIGGFTDHEWAAAYNRRILNYGEHGAYGPRVVDQMQFVVDRLEQDEASRRAVVTVWDKGKDLAYAEGATDYPCTTQLQFMIRGGELDIHVEMRANDFWFGTPHDVFTFSQLQCSLSNLMGVPAGRYYHHATSLHVYEEHYDKVAGLEIGTGDALHRPAGFGQHADGFWPNVARVAKAIAYGANPTNRPDDVGPPEIQDLTNSEAWYYQRLKPKATPPDRKAKVREIIAADEALINRLSET